MWGLDGGFLSLRSSVIYFNTYYHSEIKQFQMAKKSLSLKASNLKGFVIFKILPGQLILFSLVYTTTFLPWLINKQI